MEEDGAHYDHPIYQDEPVQEISANEYDEEANASMSGHSQRNQNQIYNEPIYELTEENLSERCTPQKTASSP